MRIAVVGTGISGMVAAYLLHDDHDLTVFEAGDYIGGHTHTVTVDDPTGPTNVDTGFIVYNEWTYPNFCKLLDHLNVATQPSNMSFSVRDEAANLEYKGDNLNTLFAQRSNLLRLNHYRMIYDILRFYRQSRKLLGSGDHETTLGEFVRAQRYSAAFVERHLIPMGAAIWSADPRQFYDFPIGYFVRFCHNHGMLNVLHRPQWRAIRGGSVQYVNKLAGPYRDRIRLRTPVSAVRRLPTHVEVTSSRYGVERFDHVILATHSDQALRLLADPSRVEREILGTMLYQRNDVDLHTDIRLLPKRKRAWASWNYHIPERRQSAATMTYNMNMLQSLHTQHTYCVTLNDKDRVSADRRLRQLVYEHPVYTTRSVAAQRRHAEISGVNRTHYCGAYWGYGFHEDGVNSALAVCRSFGKEL
ncbi:MAG: FAD-dependent oxidoreductase [Phycisphaerae bacterium]|nr:FAD-dependent oxidoreductase [Phycisphaerae bacterium]